MFFTFVSRASFLESRLQKYPDNIVKNEPMLFSCDGEFTRKNSGPITHDFLIELKKFWKEPLEEIIIDSRVHMSFTSGIYLGIPGYHHDDVYRNDDTGQPNYYVPHKVEHMMAVVNADIAPTEFAIGEASFPDIVEGEKYYKKWHPIVEKYLEWGQLKKVVVKDRQLVWFDAHSWHQAVPTVKTGWRMFIRASRYSTRKPTNEIRRQVQVYLPNPMEGW